jgi:hypothetical protein
MALFGKIVKTVVNTAVLPLEVAKDVFTLGGIASKGKLEPYTLDQLEKIKDEAGE